ncbi:uncharacterized protein TOT_030000847 [Theileria orientalis strain Shintoku]|uniref:Uncharacterized protein n=1 Tax=Theileria orientalis strain Shintoku TaxID=869250 RepID=J4DPZ9_THEOR|nr:uncharacterized protein TOT_030000847 [Theileria orientalis strain Shintoku]BAM41584.1 uncharacterized protein TOT_030000847 [Theileria orientalis strain Shintoku]|eukprot:XP_009691885.1 uncharacterized protein TOT_030000847 [Theileria orientalis strain Shintoku]
MNLSKSLLYFLIYWLVSYRIKFTESTGFAANPAGGGGFGTGGGSGFQLVPVDIVSRKSTNEIYYKHYVELNAEKYICRPGFRISQVLINGNAIKDCTDKCPNRAIILKDANNEPILRLLALGDADPDEPDPFTFTSVDLNSRKSTAEVEYKHYADLNAEKYVCKPGFLFSEILVNGKPLKRYEEKFPNRAIILKDENNEPILRTLAPGDYDPDEPEPIILTSVDLNSRKSTNEVEYIFYADLNVEKYVCRPGYLLSEIQVNGKPIKTYTEKFPNRAFILKNEANEPILRLLAPGDVDPDEPPDSVASQTSLPCQSGVDASGLKLVAVDINVKLSTDAVEYTVYDHLSLEKFQCKPGIAISEILINGKSFKQFTENYPNRAIILKDENGEPTLRVLRPGEFDPDEPIDNKFIAVDINVKQSNEGIEYTVYEHLSLEKFQCKQGYLISEILINGKSFKQFTEDFPNRAIILKDENVDVKYIQVDINVKQSTEGVDYKVYDELSAEKFVCKDGYLISAILINGNVFQEYTEDHPNRALIIRQNNEPILRVLKQGEYDPDEPIDQVPGGAAGIPGISDAMPSALPAALQPQPTLGAPAGITYITIDVTNYQSTDQYDYRKYPNNIQKFLCKPGFLVQTVTHGGDPVWKYEKGDYPNRVLILNDPQGNPFMKLLAPNETDPAEPVDEVTVTVPILPHLLQDAKPPVTLNLDNLKDTDEVEYKYDSAKNIHTFKGKGSVTFKDAVQAGTVVWKHEKGDYPNELRILTDLTGKPSIEFGFPAAKPPIPSLAPPTSQKPEIAEPPPDPNAKKSVELDLIETENTNEYTYQRCGVVDKFIPKGNHAFRVVKHGEMEVWRTIDTNKFAIKVEVDHMSDDYKLLVLYLLNNSRRLFKKKGKKAAWVPFDINTLKGSTLNVANTSGSNYHVAKDGFFRTYNAKEGQEFIKVVENNISIWEANDVIEYANKVELDASSDNMVATIYSYLDKVRVYEKSVLNNPWVRIDLTKPNPEPININYEHNSYFYYNDKVASIRTFLAKHGFVFKTVTEFDKGKKTVIWQAKNESDYAYKVEVDTMTDSKVVTIHVEKKPPKIFEKIKNGPWNALDISQPIPKSINLLYKHDTYTCTYKYDNGLNTYEPKEGFLFNGVREEKNNVWTTSRANEYAFKVEYAKPDYGKIFVSVHMSNDYTKMYIKDKENDPWTDIDTTKVNPRSLNIELDYDQYYFNTKVVNNIRKFICRDGFEFYKVKEGDRDLWKTENPDDYSYKVEMDLINNDAKAITIYQDKNRTKVFRKAAAREPWTEIDTTMVNPRSVNINYLTDSYFFRNRVDNNVRTFTPRTGFIFKSANEFLNDKKVEFWTAMNEKEYANKVEVIDFFTDQMFEVTIYQIDRVRKFVKDSKTAWKELNLRDKNPVPVDIMYHRESYKFFNRLENFLRTFTAKQSFLFNNVKESDKDIWRTEKPGEYANKVEFGVPPVGLAYVTIYLEDESTRLYTKDEPNKPWQSVDLTQLIPKSIDISLEYSIYYCSYKLENNIVKLIAKDGFEFYKVKEYNNEIWKTDDPKQYGYKVEVDLINNDSKAITIYQDNKTLVFRKNGAREPWTEIDTTMINPRSVNINYPNDSYFFRNRVDNNVRTFSARAGFLFKSVNEYVNDQKVEFWAAATDKEFATKVVIEAERKVTIHLRDGVSKRVFKKGSNNMWTESS